MDQTTIDRYLFNEMSDAEREKLEESFLDGDEMFFAIADRENELVDRYINGSLTGEALRRFEASLASNPARRQKIANGKALREFVIDERPEARTITIAERSGFFAAISDFLRLPAIQFASIGVILLLGFASIFLLMENRRLGSLEADLANARQREVELAAQIESAREVTGELTTDLDAERERIRKLEAEVAALKGTGGANSRPPVPQTPTIATLVLSPILRRGEPMKRLDLAPGVERVSIVVELAHDLLDGDTVVVQLNKFQVTASIIKNRITTTIPRQVLKKGENSIEVRRSYEVIAQHDFYVSMTK